ncbi:unnamed protein product [Notodromas monacha]|uniref:Uncharacterized protein n=1 Tax=Notodromas monacha TaxID=399045 RepID=A0A7R9BUA0_9CRUS|nr:unnamed protein product [Notodromas monacha]CAG0920251.1 unnamed protein product [Notodromas monacha]
MAARVGAMTPRPLASAFWSLVIVSVVLVAGQEVVVSRGPPEASKQVLFRQSVVSSTQSFGLRVQKATASTSTVATTKKRFKPPPIYPENRVREIVTPGTVDGEGVGSVQVVRGYGNPVSQSSRSATAPVSTSALTTLVSIFVMTWFQAR